MGRPKGSLNKATADVMAVAQKYTAEAVEVLANIMRKSQSDAAKVAAVKELLDRGHGKATQAIEGSFQHEVNSLSEAEVDRRIAELELAAKAGISGAQGAATAH